MAWQAVAEQAHSTRVLTGASCRGCGADRDPAVICYGPLGRRGCGASFHQGHAAAFVHNMQCAVCSTSAPVRRAWMRSGAVSTPGGVGKRRRSPFTRIGRGCGPRRAAAAASSAAGAAAEWAHGSASPPAASSAHGAPWPACSRACSGAPALQVWRQPPPGGLHRHGTHQHPSEVGPFPRPCYVPPLQCVSYVHAWLRTGTQHACRQRGHEGDTHGVHQRPVHAHQHSPVAQRSSQSMRACSGTQCSGQAP